MIDQLDDTRRAADDIPCVVFRELQFKAGTTTMSPRMKTELDTLARVLSNAPGHRIEIGSRLGPGRPMASDASLRADRARIIRDALIAQGVPGDSLMLERADTYERVTDEVARTGSGRVQSIGMCVHS